MSKEKVIPPIRLTETDKILINLASAKSGVPIATKARELLLAWARKVLK